ncbi:MAG: Fe-S oxidoreductase [Methanobrevibacter sp.]|nr:Fe-S oxidoreductase [Methanobrevibacter sp.]
MMKIENFVDEDLHRVLLIDPAFPIANKSRNHKDLLPVGLLKISTFLKNNGIQTKLIRLNDGLNHDEEILEFNPDFVMVTSVFTYWFNEVKDAIDYSKKVLPNVNVMVGGILASLHPDVCRDEMDCDYVYEGVLDCAEHLPPDYSILENNGKDIDFQIIHTSRGCKRACPFCGVNKIEDKDSVGSIEKELINKKKLVFYDNNLLDNPNIEDILNELIRLRKEKKISQCESQSGFDGRMLHENEGLAKLLKEANFKNPKIAWDGPFKAYKRRFEEISILKRAGYNPKDISVFMLYNHELKYSELEKKRALCFEWGVQVSDCRFRPLDRFEDGYNPHKRKQKPGEYFIHDNWSDEKVRQFRRNVRRHNICIRHNMNYHSREAELMKISKEESMRIRHMTFDEIIADGAVSDAWNPAKPHPIKNKS